MGRIGRPGGDGRGRRGVAGAGLFLASLLLSGPTYAQGEVSDPLEPINRGIFAFNQVLDGLILKPAAEIYRGVVPRPVRAGVDNFLKNLRAPIVFVNDVLQGNPERAELTLGRFMLNTIMGVGGIIDVGGHVGMPERHAEDFGQTLGRWGVGPGPYLVLPLLGPSNLRDGVGELVDVAVDPFSVVAAAGVGIYVNPTWVGVARTGAEALVFRAQNMEAIDEMQRTSLDFYATVRTTYSQFRANEIRNGAPAPLDDIYGEDIFDEDIDDEDIYEDPEAPVDPAAEAAIRR